MGRPWTQSSPLSTSTTGALLNISLILWLLFGSGLVFGYDKATRRHIIPRIVSSVVSSPAHTSFLPPSSSSAFTSTTSVSSSSSSLPTADPLPAPPAPRLDNWPFSGPMVHTPNHHLKRNTSTTTTTAASSSSGPGLIDRSKWLPDFTIHTDYEHTWPETGVLREYYLTLDNITLSPDGYERKNVLAFNGTVPGPVLEADWGDRVKVTVKNNLDVNGTGIHWHGQRMLRRNWMDGVAGVTECPIPPGGEGRYEWQVTQYGTSWYHSHYGLQYGDGAAGAFVIHGPASADYDEDLGPFMLSDWQHESIDTVFHRWHNSKKTGLPYSPNALINGMNTCPHVLMGKCKTEGKRHEVEVKRGKRYRLRLINASVDNHVKVSMDGHEMEVIAADFVPVKPWRTEWLDLAIGQRYDVIIHFTGPLPSYWFRTIAQSSCSFQSNPNDVRAIFRLSPSPQSTSSPTSSPHPYPGDFCRDPPPHLLTPIIPKSPPPLPGPSNLTTLNSNIHRDSTGRFQWTINHSPLSLDLDNPTILSPQVLSAAGNTPTQSNVYTTGYDLSPWVYLDVRSESPISHPIHLHGHDFFILDSSGGELFSGDRGDGGSVEDGGMGGYGGVERGKEWRRNPPRRDTATLEKKGRLLLAWKVDNPGVWLMHCHIVWHQDMGFGVQFVESEEWMSRNGVEEGEGRNCKGWKEWVRNVIR